MLTKPHQLFADAITSRYALGAFNASNMEVAQAIIGAADEMRSAVIVQTSEGAIAYAGLHVLKGLIAALAQEVNVPVVLHLDHGKDAQLVRQCIESGYTSVMFDASHLPFKENIAKTREVARYAHDRGVWVEAELGSILGKEGAQGLAGGRTPDELLTHPDQAAQFIEETDIDALAVSVGTIHGAFTGQEYIRFELLEAIQRAVPQTPLVVHGASGIADEHLRAVAGSHVCKINVDTELRIAFDTAVRAYCAHPADTIDARLMLGPARDAVREVVAAKMRLFGSAGRIKV